MISVVIITKNEARVIKECIKSALCLTDDIIVLDSGSTDDTIEIATKAGAKVFSNNWLGFGPQKNLANTYSKYDWILSLDADERPNQLMISTLKDLELINDSIYCFKLVDHFSDRPIRYSELRPKWKKRLFNKNYVQWDEREVHEQLVFSNSTKLIKCEGLINHFSYTQFSEFEDKISSYAKLGAAEMQKQNRTLNIIKRIFNPSFRFFRSYIMYAGFLEGSLGYRISRTLSEGLRIKYRHYDKLMSKK